MENFKNLSIEEMCFVNGGQGRPGTVPHGHTNRPPCAVDWKATINFVATAATVICPEVKIAGKLIAVAYYAASNMK